MLEQISIVGFDNVSMSRLICPVFTTVRQDMELRAKIAIEKLNDLKEHKEIEAKVTLPVKLVVRNSVRKIKKEENLVVQDAQFKFSFFGNELCV